MASPEKNDAQQNIGERNSFTGLHANILNDRDMWVKRIDHARNARESGDIFTLEEIDSQNDTYQGLSADADPNFQLNAKQGPLQGDVK